MREHSVLAMLLFLCGCNGSTPHSAPDRADPQKQSALHPGQVETTSAKPGATEEAFVDWEFGGCEPFLPSQLERRIEQLESVAGKRKIDPEQPDQKSFTLFHKAIIAGRIDLAKRLIALGADPNGMDSFGYTAIDILRTGTRSPADPYEMIKYVQSVGGVGNYWE